MRWRLPSAECGLEPEMERRAPREGVRVGAAVAEDAEGGGVGLLRRPPVRVRKAVKRAWVEERRSGVRGTLSDGGDIRLGVAGRVSARGYRNRLQHYRSGAGREGEGVWRWRARIEWVVMGALARQSGGAVATHALRCGG
tara:strand:- start:5435 stop:5854 length:420 start_codon:yes stop_codon:yes gene_type:complete